jgi:hypothetical protein
MAIFLILIPFAAFAALMLVAPAPVSLFAGAVVAVATIAYDLYRGRSIKMLAAGAATMFGALGAWIALIDGSWSATEVRLAVDLGALAIALFSILIRRPFTLQYARETAEVRIHQMPGFVRANYILTLAWAGAFVLMSIANLLTIYIPGLPFWVALAIGFAARQSALTFTKWYPQYERSKYAVSTATHAA